jgi:hypothetical protein
MLEHDEEVFAKAQGVAREIRTTATAVQRLDGPKAGFVGSNRAPA